MSNYAKREVIFHVLNFKLLKKSFWAAAEGKGLSSLLVWISDDPSRGRHAAKWQQIKKHNDFWSWLRTGMNT